LVSQIGNPLSGSGDKTVTEPELTCAVHAEKLFVKCGKSNAFLAFEPGQLSKSQWRIFVVLAGLIRVLFY
jgi:hypothetical protein